MSSHLVPREPGTEEEAVSRLLQSIGTLEACAKIAQRSKSTLAKHSHADFDVSMPLSVVAALEHAAPYPWVADWLARESGYILVPASTQAEGAVAEAMRLINRAHAALNSELVAALEDGTIDLREAKGLLATVSELGPHTASLTAVLNRRVAELQAGRAGK